MSPRKREVVDEKAAQEAREREGPARGKERQAPRGDRGPRRHLRLVLQPVGGRGPLDRREGGEEIAAGDGLEKEMDVLLVLRSPEVAERRLGRASEHGPIVALPAAESVRRRGVGSGWERGAIRGQAWRAASSYAVASPGPGRSFALLASATIPRARQRTNETRKIAKTPHWPVVAGAAWAPAAAM